MSDQIPPDEAAAYAAFDRGALDNVVVQGVEVPEHEPPAPPASGRWWDAPASVAGDE